MDQMNGLSAVKENEVAREIAAQFASFRISWVPREMNVEADRNVKDALARP